MCFDDEGYAIPRAATRTAPVLALAAKCADLWDVDTFPPLHRDATWTWRTLRAAAAAVCVAPDRTYAVQ